MKIAVFPGSFDPITVGHVDLVKRAIPLFDKIIVAVGVNSEKKYLFELEQRLSLNELLMILLVWWEERLSWNALNLVMKSSKTWNKLVRDETKKSGLSKY